MKSLLYQYNSDPSNKNISLTIGTSTFRNERAIQDLEIIENMIADINENKIEATVNMIIEKGYNKSPYLEQLANLILYFVSIKENKISIYLKLIDELSKNCEIIHWLKCHLYSKSETRSLVFEKNIL